MKKSLILLIALIMAFCICLTACDDNGSTPDSGINTHTHSFGEWITIKKVTCAEEGEMARYCDCGEKQKETLPPTGEHSEVIDEAVAPTCTESGLTEGKHCSVCNAVLIAQALIDPKGHTEVIDQAITPTCTEGGLTEGKHCSVCDAILVKQNEVPALPHTYGDWIMTKVANCGQDGEVARYCSCGAKQTEVVQGEGMHSEVIDNAVAPTCSSTGLTEGKHCSYCGTILVHQKIVPALEHTYNKNYSFNNSFHWSVCQNCGVEDDMAEHQIDDNGMCTVCNTPIGATEGIIYDKSDDGTYAMVIGYNGSATKIKIADTYEGLPVTTIYENAFYNNDKITSVVIPDSFITIGDYAFFECTSLTSVVFGNSLTSIGEAAFDWCSRLTSIVFPDSLNSIGGSAFNDCDSLTSVVFGNSLTSIGDYAFSFCDSLTSVVFSNSITYIGDHAFYYCYNLTSVVLSDNLTFIDGSTFYDCTNLQFNEYGNCKYLGSENNPYFALIKTTTENLTSYTIHEDTKIIVGVAFYECTKLSSITIPNGVISIGDEAFYDCTNLTSIVLPNTLTSIDEYAFGNCSSLNDVYYTGSEEEWKSITIGIDNSLLTSATIHYNYVPEN